MSEHAAVGEQSRAPLEMGFAVGVALREPVAQLRYYVGEIQALDFRGLRLSGLQWLVGDFTDFDLWFPWSNVLGITNIATPSHSMHEWAHRAGSDQTRHNGESS